MGSFNTVVGDLIELAKQGKFDVIGHGCNCFCAMSRGFAPQMAAAFGCHQFPLEDKRTSGDINKLGQIDWRLLNLKTGTTEFDLAVVNIYSQYSPNAQIKPLDYEALTLGLRKMNQLFNGKKIGLPRIGSGLAGGDPHIILEIIKKELKDCDVTMVKWNIGNFGS